MSKVMKGELSYINFTMVKSQQKINVAFYNTSLTCFIYISTVQAEQFLTCKGMKF